MFLVVDANILFSFFNPDSARRRVIESSFKFGFRLISPDFAFKELANDKGRIMKYSGIAELEFMLFFSLLEKKMEEVPKSEYDKFLAKAVNLAPHAKDVPYFALAISLNCPIWSDEKSFKKQNKVEVYSTEDMVSKFLEK